MSIWISHRGLTQGIPENTAGAFSAALQAGFTHFETDLRLTRDGAIVLSHDRSLERLAGRPEIIDQCDRATLAALSLPGGHSLLFWDAWEELFLSYHWTLDLKKETASAVIDALVQWSRGREEREEFLHKRTRFVCWSKEQEIRVQQNWPEAPCYPGKVACYRAGLMALVGLPFLGGIQAGKTYSLVPRFAGIPLYRRPVVERYRSYGAKVLAYLPESPADIQDALDLGFDEILTNHPPLAAGRELRNDQR